METASEKITRWSREQPDAYRLACCLSFAARVDPRLLREMRLAICSGSDAGLEADVWLHPIVRFRNPRGFTFDDEALAILRRRLARNQELYETAWKVTSSAHAGLTPAIRLEEEVAYLAGSETDGAAARLQTLLQQALKALLALDRPGLARWAARALPRFPVEVRDSEEGRLMRLGATSRLEGEIVGDRLKTEGPAPAHAAAVLAGGRRLVVLSVRLYPGVLEIGDPDQISGGHEIEVPATEPLVVDIASRKGDADESPGWRRVRLARGDVRRVEIDGPRVELKTLTGARYELVKKPVLLISYSRQDERWLELVRDWLRVVDDKIEVLDHVLLSAESGADLRQAIENQVAAADFAIVLVSSSYVASDILADVEAPALVSRAKKEALHLATILVEPASPELAASSGLADFQFLTPSGRALSEFERPDIEAVRDRLYRSLGEWLGEEILAQRTGEAASPQAQVNVRGLPPAPRVFVGRGKELRILDNAWDSPGPSVLVVTGLGGIGKSALVAHWLARLADEGSRGAQRVFGRAFYDSATLEPFVSEALEFFAPHLISKRRPMMDELVPLLMEAPTILVLDGLDAAATEARPELSRLLDAVSREARFGKQASDSKLLVIATSRETVDSLGLADDTEVSTLSLDRLSRADSEQLLRQLGRGGQRALLQEMADQLGGHPLALTTFVASTRDIPAAEALESLDLASAEMRPVKTVLEAVRQQIGKLDWDILRVAALFEGPVEHDVLASVLDGPAIPGLSEELAGAVRGERLEELVRELESRALVRREEEAGGSFSLHPLVRRYLADEQKKDAPDAWRAGHKRLYEVFEKRIPETVSAAADLAPAVAAVRHAVEAERVKEGYELYSRCFSTDAVSRTGAYAMDFEALHPFFARPWTAPLKKLDEPEERRVLTEAAGSLRAVGRPAEANTAQAEAVSRLKQSSDPAGLGWDLLHLAELNALLGRLAEAERDAQEALDVSRQQAGNLTSYASALLGHVATWRGRLDEAEKLFAEFSERPVPQDGDREDWRAGAWLGLAGLWLVDYLLATDRPRDALVRSEEIHEAAQKSGHPAIIGRALVRSGQVRLKMDEPKEALEHLERAVDALERANRQDEIPHALIARSGALRALGDLEGGREGLERALAIAEQGEMRLYLVDAHLELARTHRDRGDQERARDHAEQAGKLVRQTGYDLRDRDLAELFPSD